MQIRKSEQPRERGNVKRKRGRKKGEKSDRRSPGERHKCERVIKRCD